MAKTVVILGAGWAGLPLAHKLLKYTLPKAKDGLKVFLVSPNSHFYWNVAAVRGVIPGAIPDEQLFLPIDTGFAQYSADNFEFVLGRAERLDLESNTVEVARNDKTQCSLSYDQLVIATGSQIRSNLPFKPVGTHQETLTSLHSLQKQIDVAKSIVVAGAGPTGGETAGELAAAYGAEKDITLVISGEHVLQASHVLPSLSQAVERDLQKLSVKLVRGAQVTGVQTNAEGEEDIAAQTTLKLSNGATLVADLYLPLFGVQVNTRFVPASLLDSVGNLNLDKTMLVVGTKNVWGIGDVGNLEAKQLTVTDAQIIHLSATLDSVLTEEGGQVKEYKPSGKSMIFITMGKKYATGQIGGWKLWGWMVSYVKGRKLFIDTAQGYVGGKQLRHASM
jgi:apoptosis-inducing factor 2